MANAEFGAVWTHGAYRPVYGLIIAFMNARIQWVV